MKTTIVLCCTLLLALSAFAMDKDRKAECDKYPSTMCPKDYDPVCGSDGITYITECMLCQSNMINNQQILVAHTGMCEA